jgi:membrane protease YdiL (CAAX protease family)
VLCLLYEKTGSIVPGMILHALNNSVALLAQ